MLKKPNGIPYLACLTDGITFFSQFTSVNIYCSIFNLVCLLLYSFWQQQKVYRSNTGLLWNPTASYIYQLPSMEKKKIEYVPVIGRESTNLFMMFSPKDQICFPTSELVLEFRKLINERKDINPEEHHSSKYTHTQIRASFLPLFKRYLQRSTHFSWLLPEYFSQPRAGKPSHLFKLSSSL